MATEQEITRVLFRADQGGPFKKEVTAVFPDHDESCGLVECYAHVGQHGACSRDWYRTTRRATPEEYADLKRELESAPYFYRFKVMQRWPARRR